MKINYLITHKGKVASIRLIHSYKGEATKTMALGHLFGNDGDFLEVYKRAIQ